MTNTSKKYEKTQQGHLLHYIGLFFYHCSQRPHLYLNLIFLIWPALSCQPTPFQALNPQKQNTKKENYKRTDKTFTFKNTCPYELLLDLLVQSHQPGLTKLRPLISNAMQWQSAELPLGFLPCYLELRSKDTSSLTLLSADYHHSKGQKLVNRKDPFLIESSTKYGLQGSIRNRKFNGSLKILYTSI